VPKKIIRNTSAKKTSREASVPHSPFQLLVQDKMVEKGISYRTLAKFMSSTVKVNQSTVWHWITCKRGYPSESYFREEHLTAMSSALLISEEELRLALDRSRSLYTGQWEKNPAPQHDDLKTLRDALTGRASEWIRITYVLDLIESLDLAREKRKEQ
jgi:hypothetical protein